MRRGHGTLRGRRVGHAREIDRCPRQWLTAGDGGLPSKCVSPGQGPHWEPPHPQPNQALAGSYPPPATTAHRPILSSPAATPHSAPFIHHRRRQRANAAPPRPLPLPSPAVDTSCCRHPPPRRARLAPSRCRHPGRVGGRGGGREGGKSRGRPHPLWRSSPSAPAQDERYGHRRRDNAARRAAAPSSLIGERTQTREPPNDAARTPARHLSDGSGGPRRVPRGWRPHLPRRGDADVGGLRAAPWRPAAACRRAPCPPRSRVCARGRHRWRRPPSCI